MKELDTGIISVGGASGLPNMNKLNCRLRISNNTQDLIKIYWIPNNINIYDPSLDIRQHGKFMNNISKGYTSSFKTYIGDKFMCANNIGYL